MNLNRRKPFTHFHSIKYLIDHVKFSEHHLYFCTARPPVSGDIRKDVVTSSVLRSLLG
jgi:hypothetical protein